MAESEAASDIVSSDLLSLQSIDCLARFRGATNLNGKKIVLVLFLLTEISIDYE